MKRLSTIFTFIMLVSVSCFSQTAADYLMSCPDSIMPYISKDLRDRLIHDYRENPTDTSKVINSLDSQSALLVLKDNYISLMLNDITRMELAVLGDTVQDAGSPELLSAVTCLSPEPETIIKRYDENWKLLKTEKLSFPPEMFLADSLSEDKRTEALSYIEFPIYSCSISMVDKHDCTINVTLSLPTLTSEEKDKIKGWFVQKKIKLSKLEDNKS